MSQYSDNEKSKKVERKEEERKDRYRISAANNYRRG
jgi:hypothetical protein